MFNATQFELFAHEWQTRFIQELAGLSQSVTIMQQVMFLVLTVLISLVLLYLLFDRFVRLVKVLINWGIWLYGLYNLLLIPTIKQLLLWFINVQIQDITHFARDNDDHCPSSLVERRLQ
jgi:hypothetical protein